MVNIILVFYLKLKLIQCMCNVYICFVGVYVLEQVILNSYFNEILGEDVDIWLWENVVIYECCWCIEEESIVDFSEKVVFQVFECVGL